MKVDTTYNRRPEVRWWTGEVERGKTHKRDGCQNPDDSNEGIICDDATDSVAQHVKEAARYNPFAKCNATHGKEYNRPSKVLKIVLLLGKISFNVPKSSVLRSHVRTRESPPDKI